MRDDAVEDGGTFLKRNPLLAAIKEEQLGRRDLEQRFDVSRTTIYRATEYFEDRGLIEPLNGGYRLTPRGQGVSAAIDQYHDLLAAADHLAPLIEYVDHPMFLRSLHLFEDAELLTADPGEPYRLTEWLTGKLAETDFFRGVDPVMGNAQQHEVGLERVEAGADIASVISRTRVAEWGDLTADRLAAAKRRLGECNAFIGDDLPFTLQIYDETVVVVGLDDDTGLPVVCAVTDRVDTRDWAMALYRRYRRAAEPVDVEGLAAQ
jgi:predicted transcriptional regulator